MIVATANKACQGDYWELEAFRGIESEHFYAFLRQIQVLALHECCF